MRIKIIGDNNCARATRHLLRKAGFAVTEYLPVDVVTQAPHSGYAITIELAPVPFPSSGYTPDPSGEFLGSKDSKSTLGASPTSTPDHSTQGQPTSANGEALPSHGGASSPAFAGGGVRADGASEDCEHETKSSQAEACATDAGAEANDYGEDSGCGGKELKGSQAEAYATEAGARFTENVLRERHGVPLQHACIHFDSVDSELESAILRHVTQLATAPVVVDRPGGRVHSERELRVIVPYAQNAQGAMCMDEAAAVAVEFGILRGLLDLVSPATKAVAGQSADAHGIFGSRGGKKWWTFGLLLTVGALLASAGSVQSAPRHLARVAGRNVERASEVEFTHAVEARGLDGAYLHLEAALTPAQGQFATGQATKITDGANILVIDPCRGQSKLYVSINQTANTQLVAGTASRKIYICSIHVVVAAAASVALVEGTGAVCATGTSGVSGFGGATAATGWSFAANSGIAYGSGEAALGAEGTSADNLCLFNSGSGQVSGGISYVVQ